MKWFILIALIVIVVIEYACLCISKDADERAEEMYRRWREEHKHDKE